MAKSRIDALVTTGFPAERLNGIDRASAETLLHSRVEEARWVWPDIAGDIEDFIGYLGERLPEGDLCDTLEKIKVSDLYLAWGCAQGDDAALEAFTTHFDEMVSGAVGRFAHQGLDIDDAKQKVMEFILFPTARRSAAITLYAGHGSLKGYLGVSVVREVFRMLKAAKRMPSIDIQDPAAAFADVDDDPELKLLKTRYRAEFKQAFQEAFGALEAADRNLLRYYYVSNLNLEQIGAIIGVKHNTISRRLAKIRGGLLVGTRDRLMTMAGIGQSQFESIVRLVQSQLNVSMYRMLDTKGEPDE